MQCGGPVACVRLPITSKHSSSQQPGPPPGLCPPCEDNSMPASPCIVPCSATDWPQLDVSTCISPAQQQQLQAQQQPHHVMRQPQQQCRSQGSQHSSSGQASAPQQQHANHASTAARCHYDMGMDDTSLSTSLAAQDEQLERPGQTSASWAVCSSQAEASRQGTSRQQETGRLQQKEMSRQQGACQLQETHTISGRDGSAVGEGMVLAQGSSRAFVDGLRPCSPSGRCSPDAAAEAGRLLTGQPHLCKVFCVVSNAMHRFSVPSLDLEW